MKSGKLPDAISTYEDLGVVVYNLNGPNHKLAQHLVNQAKERGLEIEFPMVFYHLKTEKDNKFPHRLRLDLDDIAVAYHVPILSNSTSSFKSTDQSLVQNGFPSKVGEGNRTLFTAQEGGLMGLFRDGMDIYAANCDLPGSSMASRVSFFRKGAAQQDLSPLEARIAQAVRESQSRDG